MTHIFDKTFGALTPRYYGRQLIFGSLFAGLILYISSQSAAPMQPSILFMVVLNTLLYPYARFAYEQFVGFVMGQNVLFVNAFLLLIVKSITMLLCWSFALFMAPIGLIFLYFMDGKQKRYE